MTLYTRVEEVEKICEKYKEIFGTYISFQTENNLYNQYALELLHEYTGESLDIIHEKAKQLSEVANCTQTRVYSWLIELGVQGFPITKMNLHQVHAAQAYMWFLKHGYSPVSHYIYNGYDHDHIRGV